MAEAVILVGLQGSGKTTYYKDHFAATHEHVSRDIAKTAEMEAALMRECLNLNRSFVVDNTNATRTVRAPIIRQARAAGFHVTVCFFDVAVRTAIGRNNHRKDKQPIPVAAILRTAKHLQVPSLEEGIDEILLVETTK